MGSGPSRGRDQQASGRRTDAIAKGRMYNQFAGLIRNKAEPTQQDRNIVTWGCFTVEDFEHPPYRPKESLLVLAVKERRWEWFRLMLGKCDPTVTWFEGKQERSIRHLLQGQSAMRELLTEAEERWSPVTPPVLPPHDLLWANGLPRTATKFIWLCSIGARAGAALDPTSLALGAFSSFCSGVWQVITTWRERYFSVFQDRDEAIAKMNGIYNAILELEDQRLLIALASPDDSYKKNVKTSVAALKMVLEDQIKKMNGLLSSPQQPLSNRKKADQLLEEMMTDLLQKQDAVMSMHQNEQAVAEIKNAVQQLQERLELFTHTPFGTPSTMDVSF